MLLKLKRVYTGKAGTFGILQKSGHPPFAVTLEPRWLNNQRNISCIPAGDYPCFPVTSAKFRQTWEVTGVPDRTHILFHKGNIATPEDSDTQGCILVAERFDLLGSIPAVLSSKDGFNEFLEIVKDQAHFRLSIEEYY